MGFGWSLYIARRINELFLSEAKLFSKPALVNETAETIVIGPHCPMLCSCASADNLGVYVLKEDRVANVMAELKVFLFPVGARPSRRLLWYWQTISMGDKSWLLAAGCHVDEQALHRLYMSISAL